MSTRPGAPYEDRVEDEGKSHLGAVGVELAVVSGLSEG
jgi:hypothetical protein